MKLPHLQVKNGEIIQFPDKIYEYGKKQHNYLYVRKVQENWAREMLKSGQTAQGRNSMDGT